MTCPRCHGPLVWVAWESGEEFGRCSCCGWQTNFAVVETEDA